MPRRLYHIRLFCNHPGCRETSFTEAETRAEETSIRKRYSANPWRCIRHREPDELLSLETPIKTQVLVNCASANEQRYWRKENAAASGGSGFSYGPGYKAFAVDFPVGTRLIVTAYAELPPAE